MTKQHDVDQGDEFPEEIFSDVHEEGEHREAVCHRDRERNESHHRWQALLDLECGHVQERESAVYENDGGDNWDDEEGTRERRRFIVQPTLDGLAPDEDGNTQRQRYPEPLSEHVLVSRVIWTMTCMLVNLMLGVVAADNSDFRVPRRCPSWSPWSMAVSSSR